MSISRIIEHFRVPLARLKTKVSVVTFAMFSSDLPCQGLVRTDDTGKALKPNLCNVSDHNNDGKVDRKLCVDTHNDLCCPMHCV